MPDTIVFMKLRVKPGKREEVKRLWEKYPITNARNNEKQKNYFLCYVDGDENTICVFEVFSEGYVQPNVTQTDWFKAFSKEMEPLVAGPPEFIRGYVTARLQ